MTSKESKKESARVSTGIAGFDYVLNGGLPPNRVYLVNGSPGAGKSTMGFHFLMAGAAAGERVLYATLLQSEIELREFAASHGWSLDGITILETTAELQDAVTAEQTVFTTAEVELNEATDALLSAVDTHKPQRMVLDSVSELALLVDNAYQLRRQLLRLKRKLTEIGCTTIVTVGDDHEGDTGWLETLVHGVIMLDMQTPHYGIPRRRLSVPKMRSTGYIGGYHDFAIQTGGFKVYPRIQQDRASESKQAWTIVPSGNGELDTLLGGGLETGTACLIAGTTGAGKSTLASLYVQTAAERGDRAAYFCFDERRDVFLRRAAGLKMPITDYVASGLVDLRQFNVGDITSGQFAQLCRAAVDHDKVRVVVIDSLTGYFNAIHDPHELIVQLHELLSFLASRGVLTLMVVTTHGLANAQDSEIDASYIADTVVLLRHFEAAGRRRQCIAALKKRHGQHESLIREIHLGEGGIHLGPPLTQFTGVLKGDPVFHGDTSRLLDKAASEEADALV